MWDLMRDVAVQSGMLAKPKRPSFSKDILPIFERMTNLQWVNAGFAAAFGWGGQFDYTTAEWVKKLNNPSSANFEMRRTISNNFRRYDVSGAEAPQLWPWMYGDAVAIPTNGSVRQHSTLSDLQLGFLDQWVKGDFDADFIDTTGCPHVPEPITIDKLPVAEQPEMLTKAAMDFCLADAFHPGCEMTWPMRSSGMYSAPFRLKHVSETTKADHNYYGSTMNEDVLTMSAGPLLGGQVAGSVTRWMAVPWQTDTASCRDGYTTAYDPYLPTFWPARVPNNILSMERYQEAIDPDLKEETRKEAFAYRYFWLDNLPMDGEAPTQTNQINKMVKYFDKLAVVQAKPGVKGDPNFPDQMQVAIVPDHRQNNELLKETKARLIEILAEKETAVSKHGTLQKASGNSSKEKKKSKKKEAKHKAEVQLLTTTLDHLSKDGLLNENYLMERASAELTDLVSHELVKDNKLSAEVEKLLNLLASKTHETTKKAKPQQQHTHSGPQKSVGVPERMVRFQRFIPKKH